jgi:hypothetical protein
MDFMDRVLSLIFWPGIGIVSYLGGTVAILTIGLLPIYVAIVVYFILKVPIRRSGLSLVLYCASPIISLLVCAVLFISAMVMSAWG